MIKRLTLSFFVVYALSAALMPSASASSTSGDAVRRSGGTPATKQDKNVRALVDSMRDATIWGHPDRFGQYKGMVAYTDHDYKTALEMFRIGARYADKVSQLSIGLMYLNGKGVARYPVEAWAWTSLSAERGYPAFKATRDRIWQGLSPSQRVAAKAERDTLASTYADSVAKPRMIRKLHEYRTRMTGSHTGFDSGVKQSKITDLEGVKHTPDNTGDYMRAEHFGLRVAGCASENLYADQNWDPKVYFKARDAQYMGTVTVGALENGKGNAAAGAKGRK